MTMKMSAQTAVADDVQDPSSQSTDSAEAKPTANYAEIIYNGIWKNNPALVQLLGLCPMLAVTSTVVNALGLGLATLVVLVGSNIAVSIIRNYVSEAVRLPAFVMIIASFTTSIELIMQAYTYELYQILGIFIPLIVTNCAISSCTCSALSGSTPSFFANLLAWALASATAIFCCLICSAKLA